MYAVMPNCNWKILQIQRKLPFLVLELWIPYGAWDTEPGRSGEAHLAEHVLIGIIRRNLSFYEQVNSYGYTNSYRIRISWIMEPSRLQERIGAIVNDLSRAALDQKLFDQEKSKVIQEINTIKKTDSLTLVEEVEQIIYQKKKEEVTAQGDTRQLEQIDFPSFLEKLKKVMNEEGIVFTLTGDIEDLNLFPNRQPLTEHTSQVSLSLKQGRDEMCLSLSTHDGDIKAFRWQIWDIGSAHAAEILETFLEFRSADERIRIRSVVGRYLEHSRIYIFGKGEEEKMYIASADFMTRNTVRRVEVATPIYDPDIRDRVREMFDIQMSDNVKARVLREDGTYKYVRHTKPAINAQEIFYDEAYKAVEE